MSSKAPDSPYTIRALGKSDLDQHTIDHLVSLSILSFNNGNDQWVLSGTGGNLQHADGFFRSRFLAGMASPEGHIYVASTENSDAEEIIGVALWIGPGDELYSTEAQRAAYLDKWYQELDPALLEWWNTQQAAPVNRLVKNVRRDTWSLSILAVSPQYRRKGIARNLVKTVQEKALAEGSGISVLTQSLDNVKTYEGMGFSISGDTRIIGGAGGDYTIFFLTLNWPPEESKS